MRAGIKRSTSRGTAGITTSTGTKTAIDPHAIDAFGRQTVSADVVLMSHMHPDHVRLEVVENKDKAKILAGLKQSGGEAGRPPRVVFNAVDALPNGGTILIRSYPDQDRAVLEVQDTGVGMTEEVKARFRAPYPSR